MSKIVPRNAMIPPELVYASTIADYISPIAVPVILALTLVSIWYQIKKQTHFRKLEAYNHLYAILASEESSKARRLVYRNKRQIKQIGYVGLRGTEFDNLRYAIGRVTSDIEHIGRLVDKKDIDTNFAYETRGCWGWPARTS